MKTLYHLHRKKNEQAYKVSRQIIQSIQNVGKVFNGRDTDP